MREVFDDLVERRLETLQVLGEERAPAADGGQARDELLKARALGRAALSDHVHRRVARFDPTDRRVERGVARLVLAVAEDDEGAASRLAPERVDAEDDGV